MRGVLKVAGPKRTLIPVSPGLVEGYYIGGDLYYLLYKSDELGFGLSNRFSSTAVYFST